MGVEGHNGPAIVKKITVFAASLYTLENLNKNFEGDHIHSYSKGGKTLLPNGQALCLPCNRKKGNKTR